MTPLLRIVTTAFIVLCSSLLGSCSKKPDFTVEISGDTKGVKPGSQVTYRGAEAGIVTGVTPSNGKFRIEARLKDEYRGQIRGAKARAVNGLTTQFNPQLCIVGSDDPKAPLLKAGQQVPEASALDAVLSDSKRAMSGWAVAGIALVICVVAIGALLRGLAKIAVPVTGIALVVAWLMMRQPEIQPQAQLSTQSGVEDLLATARSVLESPENRAMWQANEWDVMDLLEKTKGKGGEHLEAAKRQLSASIDAIEKDATRVATRELEKLKVALEKFGNEKARPPVRNDPGGK